MDSPFSPATNADSVRSTDWLCDNGLEPSVERTKRRGLVGVGGLRKRNSVRFAPYFKVQTYRENVGAWSDARGTFATLQEARLRAARETLPTRIREISMEGTRLL